MLIFVGSAASALPGLRGKLECERILQSKSDRGVQVVALIRTDLEKISNTSGYVFLSRENMKTLVKQGFAPIVNRSAFYEVQPDFAPKLILLGAKRDALRKKRLYNLEVLLTKRRKVDRRIFNYLPRLMEILSMAGEAPSEAQIVNAIEKVEIHRRVPMRLITFCAWTKLTRWELESVFESAWKIPGFLAVLRAGAVPYEDGYDGKLYLDFADVIGLEKI